MKVVNIICMFTLNIQISVMFDICGNLERGIQVQYYIKIFNKTTDELVGYYKDTGINCITKLPKGMKYFNTLNEALVVSKDIDEGFIRDKNGKYYIGHAVIYGDHTREPKKSIYRNNSKQEGDDYDNAVKTFIRQNSSRNRR